MTILTMPDPHAFSGMRFSDLSTDVMRAFRGKAVRP
jgi:hypothetical protein